MEKLLNTQCYGYCSYYWNSNCFVFSGRDVKINIIETTDVHGVIFPFDFVENKPLDASLASLSTMLSELRTNNSNVLLLDNGDILQGQPAVYYYNFVDTLSPHICASVMNYMGYEAATTGKSRY